MSGWGCTDIFGEGERSPLRKKSGEERKKERTKRKRKEKRLVAAGGRICAETSGSDHGDVGNYGK
jgi:hypothetical protein